ncbi:MAG: hypothetical protein LBS72_05895 [Oscillospiraceae bacterium]|jgi:PHP family Zn ribbon phosphoesterase|nr:hypothetical protein [Oscillospiraceae bacterium]
MKVPVDLHIHSCLSPCANDDMTPGNIAGMAALAGIRILAVTDHNCALNLPACEIAAQALGLQLLPGLEVTTREEAHCLCYFTTVENALNFGERIEAALGDAMNLPRLFGNQYVMNAADIITASVPKLLIQSTKLTLDELDSLARAHGGLLVPAHINRGSNGLLQCLGFLPDSPRFAALEVSPTAPAPLCDLRGHHILNSSDAHRLDAILEPAQYLELAEATTAALFDLMERWYRQR